MVQTRSALLLAPALFAAAASFAAQADSPSKLLRLPDVHGERIVFVHAGDIHVVSASGGTALRLTTHEGEELYPKFSPDGSQLAFSAEYNGTRQVYVMPASGGPPRQLTWYTDIGPMPPRGGTDYRVLDWTPDGRHVLVRANRVPFDDRGGRPYLVPVDGGMETPLKVPETGGGMLSPDGTRYVYTPVDREFRTWKRYRGGRAQDVWIYDLANDTSLRLTNHRGTDNQPLWVGDSVYFTSDRDYLLELYAVAPSGGEPRKLTAFDDFDILWPSAGPDSIVFEKGGSIWHFDPASGKAREVPIRVAGDRPGTLPRFVEGAEFVESFDLSPAGERAVFGTRGEVFTVPAEHGAPRNLSHTPDAREISVSWSPDGTWIAYLSDATGEYELYVRPQDGTGEPRQVTRDGNVWRFPPVWSPDSKKLVFGDKRQQLNIVDVASGRLTVADHSDKEDLTDYAWSPDSRWLAYVKTGASRNSSIWLYSLDQSRATQLTPDETSEVAPAWDPEGRFLYFLSNRDFNLAFSAYEFNYLYNNATRVYAAALAAGGAPPNPPKQDEVGDGEGKDDGGGDKDAPLAIDIASFNERVVALGAPSGNYRALSANAEGVFFIAQNGPGQASLQFLALAAEKPAQVAAGVGRYALSADGSKLLLQKGNAFAIVPAQAEADFDKGKLALDAMDIRIEPAREWKQMFTDAWRILRDWFYEPGMHGNDWQAIHDKYAALLPHVSTRADLDYLFGEMAGELNAGHVYVQAGDQPELERLPGGLLGAEIVAHDSGFFRVAHVFRGENWHPDFRSPLTMPAVDVDAGDFILAVDRVPTGTVENFYRLLENKGGRQVELLVNDRPSTDGARRVLVQTLTSEQNLRYLDAVAQKRALVDELSGGRIGYIHVPNTAVEGNRELFRGMLAYAHKDALIIDDRYNGGGFIPDRMIELLAREPLNYWKSRGVQPNATPLLSHRGPQAMLINGLSSSGGDALPYYFRKLKLGTLIGTRTWGGLIGISGNPPLADNGTILAATFRFLDTDGEWAVENEGVAPDIEVIDRPELIAAGRDPSIERAVQLLLAELEQHPVEPVTAPPPPTQFPPATD